MTRHLQSTTARRLCPAFFDRIIVRRRSPEASPGAPSARIKLICIKLIPKTRGQPYSRKAFLVRTMGGAHGGLPAVGPASRRLARCSPLRGLRPGFFGVRRPVGPLRAGFRPRPPPLGRALAGAHRRSGASAPPFGGPFAGSVPAPALCLGLSPPAAARRSAAALAPRPARSGPPSARLARPRALVPRSPWRAPWPLRAPSAWRRASRAPLAPSAWAGPPGRPPLVAAGRSVPSLRRLGGASGSAPPRGGPLAALTRRLFRPRPPALCGAAPAVAPSACRP